MAVLTKFLRKEQESRPYWLGGGVCSRRYREGHQGAPTGPEGWYRTSRDAVHRPPTPAPPGASGARFAVCAPLSSGTSSCSVGPVLPTGIPTRYHTPLPVPAAVHRRCHAAGTWCTCGNSCFGHLVGEPRGLEHSRIMGPRLDIYSYLQI